MSEKSKSPDKFSQRPLPGKLINSLDLLDTEQKISNYLRNYFVDQADVDEYIQSLDFNEKPSLSKKQIMKLKMTLAGFKIYLEYYLKETAERIKRINARFRDGVGKLDNEDLTPEEVERITQTRKRIAQALHFAKSPRGINQKKLMDVASRSGDVSKHPNEVLIEKTAIIAVTRSEDANQPDQNRITAKECHNAINGLRLSREDKEKLVEIILSYDEAFATAYEFRANIRIPSMEKIIANIVDLGEAKLEIMLKNLSKPKMVIVPDMSMEKLVEAMDKNPHFGNQHAALLEKGYKWGERKRKVEVVIMDMVQNPGIVPGQKPGGQSGDKQLRICEKYLSDLGLRMCTDREYAVGMQLSLRAYERALMKEGQKDAEKHIPDSLSVESGSSTVLGGTTTMFNQEQNPTISKIARGYFTPKSNRVRFNHVNAKSRNDKIYARGVLQIY
jgi:hypothetical protein